MYGLQQTLRENHLRDDPRNHLVERTGVFVEELRPKILVMENARELLMGNFKHHALALRAHLEHLGYTVSWGVHVLTEFGLPQVRERALVVAVRDRGRAFTLEDLWAGQGVASACATVRRGIAHLPPVGAGQVHPSDPMHVSPSFADPVSVERLAAMPHDGGSWADLIRHPRAERLLIPSMKSAAARGDFGSHPDVYGRLWWDGPCITIKRECSHVGNGRYSHPEQDRMCTVRELALLNGFPAGYTFLGSLSNKYRHIGDAVPPLISFQLAQVCAWILTGKRPTLTDCILPGTSLHPRDIVPKARTGDLFAPRTATSRRAQVA